MKHATLFVRFDAIGIHRWPSAVGSRSYLSHPHRHKFIFEVRIDAMHDDREIEFHDIIDRSRALLPKSHSMIDFGSLSCEAIARQLADGLSRQYGREVEVLVSEDGEVGAIVRSKP